ncbi:MAG: hypothetical protein ACOZAR_02110 [Patescibacteria group bacterium]
MENIPERQEKSLNKEGHLDQKIEKQTYKRLIVDLSDRQIKEDAREEIFRTFLEERDKKTVLPELYELVKDKPFIVRLIIKNTPEMAKKMEYFDTTYTFIENTKKPQEKSRLLNELFNIKNGNID